MKLFLLRHAEAENDAHSDEARRLTPRGVEQARMVGRFCARTGIAPGSILHSPFVRTEQTAQAVAEAWPPGTRTLQAAPFAASGMLPEIALVELRAYERFGSVMLVGHQPDIGLLAASLLGLRDAGSLPVGKATLIGLTARRFASMSGELEFCVPVELMR